MLSDTPKKRRPSLVKVAAIGILLSPFWREALNIKKYIGLMFFNRIKNTELPMQSILIECEIVLIITPISIHDVVYQIYF